MEELEPKYYLWTEEKPARNPDKTFAPYLVPYLIEDGQEHDAMVILPGGGYWETCKEHEGIVISKAFRELGFHTFIVDYRCCRGNGGYTYPAPQQDAIRAMRIIRGHAAEWRIRPNRIAVIGFSAGGHLCSSLAVWHDSINADAGDAYDSVSGRPDAVVLSYAVISAACGHIGSFENLMEKKEMSGEELAKLATDRFVTPDCPPAFIWATATDQIVPVSNSYSFAEACQKNGVPYALHVYPYGRHGLSIGIEEDTAEIRSWPSLCRDFLNAVWKKVNNNG